MSARSQIRALADRVSESIIGQEHMVERLLIGLLANGNLLVEGLPGLAKTRAVKALAQELAADFSRIQFTPDLLPSDVTGTEVYHNVDGTGEFRFEPGPIFANIALADEINRAPAKVQAALLEAMEERTVTVAKRTHSLPPLFMVMATQNPIEQEGTYPLPEAQMDRFLMHVVIGYPDEAAEAEIMRLVRGEQTVEANATRPEPIAQEAIFQARDEIGRVHVSEAAEGYMVDLVFATRYPERYSEELASWIEVGASPRGTLALDKCSRVHAWLHEQDHVTPENIRAIVHDVLRHRLMLSYEANAAGVMADRVIDEILLAVAVA
ncbi:MAG: AAA family ATPase [Longimicrobiales bacterium]